MRVFALIAICSKRFAVTDANCLHVERSQCRLISCRNRHGSFRTRRNWLRWTLISAGKPLTKHCTHNFQASACNVQVIQRWTDDLASHTQLAGGPLEWNCFTHIEISVDLIEIKQDSQRNKEALPHWEFMLEHNEEDCPTRCSLEWVSRRLKMFLLHRNCLGRTYKKIGNVEKALHHYKKANAIDPDFAWWFKWIHNAFLGHRGCCIISYLIQVL